MKSNAQPIRRARRHDLGICILALLLGSSQLAAPVQAKDMSTLWTTLSESAPRSIFDEIRDSAPLAPVFETLRDSAP